MKRDVKNILCRVLAVSSLFFWGLAAAQTHWSSGAGAGLKATASLRLSVVVPKILILRVGHPGGFIDEVYWDATPTPGIGDAVYNGSIPPDSAALPYAVHDTIGNPNNGAISFKLWSNAGTTTLRAVAANHALLDGANSIPIVPGQTITTTPTTTNPVIDGSAKSFTANAQGIVYKQSSQWKFVYHPDTVSPPPAAGIYTTVVTYTASTP